MNSAARICLISLFLMLPRYGQASAAGDDAGCDHHVAQWLDPASGAVLDSKAVFERLSGSRIVLLGEAHTTVAHHRWQHYMLAALHSRNPNMMVGFEMLPRRAQPVLDDWSAGKLDEKEFLERSKWREVWGYDAGLYLPLLHFARLNRLPALALNIDRALVSRVGQQGWSAIDEAERMGLSNPAPASGAYRESLARLYRYKKTMGINGDAAATQQEPDLAEIMRSDAFANFVDAQLTWDRAMAEALADAHRRDPAAMVVGIIGRGHLEHGYGIPHQLADMGIENVDVLLPLGASDTCNPLPADLAAAVFVVDDDGVADAPARPRLGIIIESVSGGVRVMEVVEDSVAAATGIREGDLIQAAAGFNTRTSAELIEVIQRQAPGTWLPLTLLRGKESLELTAKFPQSFE
ncbi:MAG: ChaN family lipoprotein [Gammaproteobacteria bacterium]|nr:ChaN family lipoprotein [Gammaproteobacteria bacterium]